MREISGVGLMNALSFIPDLMELSPDFKSALISDIVISIIFVFVGLLFDIIQAKKRAKMNTTNSQWKIWTRIPKLGEWGKVFIYS